jgi:hypothetical protein
MSRSSSPSADGTRNGYRLLRQDGGVQTDGELPGETERRLLQADAELIFGVLAVVGTSMLVGDSDELANSIRRRLSRDGAIPTPEAMGEASVVVQRLSEQMLYVLGALGEPRPELRPMPTLSVHSLALPDQDSADACLADIQVLEPARTRMVDSRSDDLRYTVELDIALPGLPPNADWLERQRELIVIARRHGGAWVAGTDTWW